MTCSRSHKCEQQGDLFLFNLAMCGTRHAAGAPGGHAFGSQCGVAVPPGPRPLSLSQANNDEKLEVTLASNRTMDRSWSSRVHSSTVPAARFTSALACVARLRCGPLGANDDTMPGGQRRRRVSAATASRAHVAISTAANERTSERANERTSERADHERADRSQLQRMSTRALVSSATLY